MDYYIGSYYIIYYPPNPAAKAGFERAILAPIASCRGACWPCNTPACPPSLALVLSIFVGEGGSLSDGFGKVFLGGGGVFFGGGGGGGGCGGGSLRNPQFLNWGKKLWITVNVNDTFK